MYLSIYVPFNFAVLIDKFNGSISKPNSDDVTGTFTKRHPVMIYSV